MNPAARKFHRLRPPPAGLAALGLITLVAPLLAAQLHAALADGTNLLVAWNGRGTLETAPHPAANWQPLTNATSPHRHRPTNATAFFRLNQTVDATTLHRKVLCGYQGWFRAPGDGGSQWIHWSRDPRQITTSTVTFEMWPDLTEYGPDERYPAGDFTHPDGSPAHLFSSQNSHTVHRHFDWMRDYGIDGVFVQRFVSDIPDRPWMTNVLNHARAAARRTGRVLALTYDLSGAPTNTVFSRLTNDWRWLALETGLTGDPRYLHHAGRPVLMVWGFFADRMHPGLAAQIIGWFRTNPIQPVTLVGGCQWWWRTESAPGWSNVFRQFDVISPWNVGNYSTAGTNKWASTAYWAADRAAAAAAGMLYLPVLYPGFSWDNLQRLPPGTSLIPRRGGEFFWRQFHDAAQLSLDMAYVAMFDEVDEGTAIFKVSNTPPVQGYWVTYDGLPTDWYLRLTAAGTAMLAGERPLSATIPITP
ncbi:MAG: glycoside hydrolase family 71/99-like protein [Limisphaerales bacterium]